MTSLNYCLRGKGVFSIFSASLDSSGPITVGRRATHQILLEDPTVSRDHAIFTFRKTENGDGDWFLTDQDSRHGTFVNDCRLDRGETKKLCDGDVLKFGQFLVQYERDIQIQDKSILDSAFIEDGIDSVFKRFPSQKAVSLSGIRIDFLRDSISATNELATIEALEEFLIETFLYQGALSVACVKYRTSIEFGVSKSRSQEDSLAIFPINRQLLKETVSSSEANYFIASEDDREIFSICFPVKIDRTICFLIYARWDTDLKENEFIEACHLMSMVGSLCAARIDRQNLDKERSEDEFKLYQGMIDAFVAAIDAKDPYTQGHSKRVSMLARQLSLACDCGSAMVYHAELCGLVHDVGKIGVPESVLLKKGRLDNDEFEKIKAHPSAGARILSRVHQMEPILPGVLQHHERFGGGGYPLGISGETIHPLGRLIAICDAFDAMSSSRCYRDALPREYVFKELEKGKGIQFDPKMVDAFLSLDLTFYDQMIVKAAAYSNKTIFE